VFSDEAASKFPVCQELKVRNVIGYSAAMLRKHTKLEEHEEAIKRELLKRPHASEVARKSEGAWSYSTVWRVADRNDIALTAGRETMGRRRLSQEQAAAVRGARKANPNAPQIEIARQVGISRSSVWRIEGGSPRRRARAAVATIG